MVKKDLVTAKLAELGERVARVAHGYGHVDAKMVFSAATSGLTDLDRFAREVAAWTQAR